MSFKILIENLSKSFDAPVLKDCTLSLESGKFYTLLGDNGSGKTTLLKILAGVLLPDGGLIKLNDKILCNEDCLELASYAGANVNTFYQKLSAHENMLLTERIFKQSSTGLDVEQKLTDILEIETFKDKPFYQMSQGMKASLSIYREFQKNRSLLLFDESLSYFPEKKRESVFDFFKTWSMEQNKIIVLSSHIKTITTNNTLRIENGFVQCL